MKKHLGFSLIELMIVIAIILIIAAIAIPDLLRTRIQENERATVYITRIVRTAMAGWQNDYHGYPAKLTDLKDRLQDPDVSRVVVQGHLNVYQLTYSQTETGYILTAVPEERVANSGYRSFYLDQTGIIRFNKNGPATKDSPPLPKND